MSDNSTPLCFASIDELVDELNSRELDSFMVIVREDRATDETLRRDQVNDTMLLKGDHETLQELTAALAEFMGMYLKGQEVDDE